MFSPTQIPPKRGVFRILVELRRAHLSGLPPAMEIPSCHTRYWRHTKHNPDALQEFLFGQVYQSAFYHCSKYLRRAT